MELLVDGGWQFDPLLVIVGLIVGGTVGLTGVGSGSLLTPILLLLGVRPVDAVGASLVNSLVMKSVGTAQHDRQGTLSRSILVPLLAGAVPGAVAGSLAVVYFSVRAPAQTDLVMRVAIALALAAAALTLLHQILRDRKARKGIGSIEEAGASIPAGVPLDAARLPRRLALLCAGFGVLTGLVIAITSIGAGSFLMPFLIVVFAARVRLNRLVGTDVAVGAAVGLIATMIYLASGTVQFGPLLWLLAGSIPGVLLGSKTNVKLDTNGTRAAVSSVTLLVAVVMIYGGIVHG